MNKLIIILLMSVMSFGFTNTNNLTLKQVYDEIVHQEIKHPKIVLRQVIEETGWLKCTNCSRERNNIFGWYYKKKYLTFNTWQDCVAYYKRWQDKHYDGKRDYYEFLDCMRVNSKGECTRYATNPKYTGNLKRLNIDEIFK